MEEDIDLDLADKLQFHPDHEMKLIKSSDPNIYLEDRGCDLSLNHNIRYLTLHWSGRKIPARAHRQSHSLGKNSSAQPIVDIKWIIQDIGYEDRALSANASKYAFQSKQELICSVYIYLKALAVYGGLFNVAEVNFFSGIS